MEEICLLMSGWDERTGWTGWEGDGREVPAVEGTVLGASPLALELRWAEGIDG